MAQIKPRLLPQPPNGLPQNAYEWMRQVVSQVTFFMNDVAEVINEGKLDRLQATVWEQEPDNVVDGVIVYADGTSWNPGSGEGLYERRAGAWVKL